MTARERVIAAINFQKPDRVPHSLGFTWQLNEKMIEYTGDPKYKTKLQNHIAYTSLLKPQVEVRPEHFMDEFGVIWDKTGLDKDIGVVENVLLEEPEDLETFEFPPVDEEYIRARLEKMCSGEHERFRVAAMEYTLYERAWTLRGMENFLCDMLMEPEFVDELLDKITDRLLAMLDIALEYDIDGIYFTDDWGQQKGLIMGPKLWRQYIKPRMAKLYKKIHDAGKYVVHHSCGDLREIMDEFYEIGVNVYQTFQPEIYGLDYAKNIYGKIAIWGGLSTQRDLPTKSPDEVREITRQLLAAFPNGGLIASPTHTMPIDIPPENVMAMLDVLLNQ